MKKRIRNIFLILIPICTCIGLISFSISICTKSYSDFIQSILQSIERADLDERIKTTYFPESKFFMLKIAVSVLSIILTLLSASLILFRERYFAFISKHILKISKFIESVFSTYSSISKQGKFVLWIGLFLLLLRSLWYAQTFSIQFDEAWNYNLFLSKNLFYSLGAYNNYPLHNIVSWFFIQCFGNEVLVLRLPSIIMGCITVFSLCIVCINITKNEWLSISLAFLFACLPVSVFYMMYARGVLFEIFFSIIVSSFLIKKSQNGFQKNHLLWLGLLNALGTYSMLSHIYFIGASSLFLFMIGFTIKKSRLVFAVSYFFISMIGSGILLIPFFLGTGMELGIEAAYGAGIPIWDDYLQNIYLYSSFITGTSWGLFISLSCMLLILLVNVKRYSVLVIFTFCLAVVMFIVPATTHIFPPPRAFGFLVLIPIISLGIIFSLIINYNNWIGLAFACVAAIFFSERAHTHPFLNWSKELDKEVEHASEVMIENNIHLPYNDCRDFDYFIPGISYYYKQYHQNIQFTSSAKQSTRYTKFSRENADAIIMYNASTQSVPHGFKLIYAYGDVCIYKKYD